MNLATLKGLKGAPITILWIMQFTPDRKFRKADFYKIFTDKTVAAALETLESADLIEEENKMYFISKQYDLVLGVFPVPTTTVLTDILINKDIKSNSTSEFFRQESYDLLRDVGIGNPKLTELASLEHATVEFVKWRIEQWEERKKVDSRVRPGLLITLIECYEEPPKEKEKCPHCGVTLSDGWCWNSVCEGKANA